MDPLLAEAATNKTEINSKSADFDYNSRNKTMAKYSYNDFDFEKYINIQLLSPLTQQDTPIIDSDNENVNNEEKYEEYTTDGSTETSDIENSIPIHKDNISEKSSLECNQLPKKRDFISNDILHIQDEIEILKSPVIEKFTSKEVKFSLELSNQSFQTKFLQLETSESLPISEAFKTSADDLEHLKISKEVVMPYSLKIKKDKFLLNSLNTLEKNKKNDLIVSSNSLKNSTINPTKLFSSTQLQSSVNLLQLNDKKSEKVFQNSFNDLLKVMENPKSATDDVKDFAKTFKKNVIPQKIDQIPFYNDSKVKLDEELKEDSNKPNFPGKIQEVLHSLKFIQQNNVCSIPIKDELHFSNKIDQKNRMLKVVNDEFNQDVSQNISNTNNLSKNIAEGKMNSLPVMLKINVKKLEEIKKTKDDEKKKEKKRLKKEEKRLKKEQKKLKDRTKVEEIDSLEIVNENLEVKPTIEKLKISLQKRQEIIPKLILFKREKHLDEICNSSQKNNNAENKALKETQGALSLKMRIPRASLLNLKEEKINVEKEFNLLTKDSPISSIILNPIASNDDNEEYKSRKKKLRKHRSSNNKDEEELSLKVPKLKIKLNLPTESLKQEAIDNLTSRPRVKDRKIKHNKINLSKKASKTKDFYNTQNSNLSSDQEIYPIKIESGNSKFMAMPSFTAKTMTNTTFNATTSTFTNLLEAKEESSAYLINNLSRKTISPEFALISTLITNNISAPFHLSTENNNKIMNMSSLGNPISLINKVQFSPNSGII